MCALLVYLVLLCANEGPLVYVWVDLNVRVVAEFESILFVVLVGRNAK